MKIKKKWLEKRMTFVEKEIELWENRENEARVNLRKNKKNLWNS